MPIACRPCVHSTFPHRRRCGTLCLYTCDKELKTSRNAPRRKGEKSSLRRACLGVGRPIASGCKHQCAKITKTKKTPHFWWFTTQNWFPMTFTVLRGLPAADSWARDSRVSDLTASPQQSGRTWPQIPYCNDRQVPIVVLGDNFISSCVWCLRPKRHSPSSVVVREKIIIKYPEWSFPIVNVWLFSCSGSFDISDSGSGFGACIEDSSLANPFKLQNKVKFHIWPRMTSNYPSFPTVVRKFVLKGVYSKRIMISPLFKFKPNCSILSAVCTDLCSREKYLRHKFTNKFRVHIWSRTTSICADLRQRTRTMSRLQIQGELGSRCKHAQKYVFGIAETYVLEREKTKDLCLKLWNLRFFIF